jgi:hypothetical protein
MVVSYGPRQISSSGGRNFDTYRMGNCHLAMKINISTLAGI